MSWLEEPAMEVAGHVSEYGQPMLAASPGWLGKVLLSFSLAGLPLVLLLMRRAGRRGGIMVAAGCAMLFVRDITMVTAGAPAKLRTLARLLLFTEATTSGLATFAGLRAWVWPLFAHRASFRRASVSQASRSDTRTTGQSAVIQSSQAAGSVATVAAAATFALHAARQAIYLSPGHGLLSSPAQGEHPLPRQPREADAGQPREIAPDVYFLQVGKGLMRSNVYFVRSGPSWVLIDAGAAKCREPIQKAADSLFGESARPVPIILTHSHPDHAGSARELARMWDCPVYVHPDELPLAGSSISTVREYANPLDRWAILPFLRLLGRRRTQSMLSRAGFKDVALPLDPSVELPGLPGWKLVATPGHTPGHVAFFRAADRVLIAGDALLTVSLNSLWGLIQNKHTVSGPPWYTTWNWPAAKQSVASLATLEPRVLADGHGIPASGAETAGRIRAFSDRL